MGGRAWAVAAAIGVACAPAGEVRGPGGSSPGIDPPSETTPSPGDPPPTTGPTTGTPTLGGLAVPDHVALPFVSVGQAVPDGVLAVTDPGGAPIGPVSVDVVDGPFAVTGTIGVVPPGGAASVVVSYTGSVDAPTIALGEASVDADGAQTTVLFAAVIGDPNLPEPGWDTDVWGTHAIAQFPSAPFPEGSGGAWADGSVLVSVPPALTDAEPLGVVTHLHGFYAVLDATIGDQRLVEQHAMSGRNAVFVAPQGPVNAASGDFGQLEAPGGHERLIRDVISVLYRDGLVERPVIGDQALTSHSGGYAAAATLVGDAPFAALHLFDSVYGYVSTFEDYAADGGVLFSNYSAYGGTVDTNLQLAAGLDDLGVDVADDFRLDRMLTAEAVVGYTPSEHMDVATDGLAYARWLTAGPLPRSPLAAPELLAVIADGAGGADVTWRGDRVPASGVVVVEGSDDGVAWDELGRVADPITTVHVDARPFVRLVGEDGRGGRGSPSDRYAGAGGDWLVVDGFHRVFGGSWALPTHDFAGRVGLALGGASTAVDDAVSEGIVDLADYDHVVWLLGDESLADGTFDADAADAVDRYLAGGGALLVSGAELGYASDQALLDTLGVDYVADDAGTTRAGGWTFGVVYPEDYPDVLSARDTVWTYATGGGAAVGRDHQVLAVGFGVETLADADLAPALAELAAYLR